MIRIQWEMEYALAPETSYMYPEEDLLQSLVSLYFEKMNPLLPVIHRPTFMKSLSIGQHLWDQSFGMTVLLVCALGARYSHDPRITVPSETSGTLSSGWQYFSQVPLVHRRIMVYKTTVYDLQYFSVCLLSFSQQKCLLQDKILARLTIPGRYIYLVCLLDYFGLWTAICGR